VKRTLWASGVGLGARTGLWALGLGLWAAAAPPPVKVSFHHIHVNDDRAAQLLDYYGKLFDHSTTHGTTVGDFRGIESKGVFLLVTPVPRPPADEGSAGWHFGWGTVSLDEAYDRHRMQEIEWKLPLEGFARDLHLHLESADPIAAGEWYRDRFGARLETEPQNAVIQPVRAMYRRPVAIARLDVVALAIYKAPGPLQPSRGHRIDHIAFVTDLAEARKAGLKVLEPSAHLGAHETMMIEGPDQMAVELVDNSQHPERQLPRNPL
jgi:hypothetical protein